MGEPKQKSIGVTPHEKAQLDRAKELFENSTGDRGDWGQFLAAASLLALAALGVYKLAKTNRSRPVVECPACKVRFPVAYSGDPPRVAYVQCPECDQELVVDLG